VRTTIDIDDTLMGEALRASGAKTKRALIEDALRLLVRLKDHEEILRLAGKVKWKGNLSQSRMDRNSSK